MTCDVCSEPMLKRDSATCADCNKTLCPRDTWFYVDESNIAITRSAAPKCKPCQKGKK